MTETKHPRFQPVTERHCVDGEGNPAGGKAWSMGIDIEWQCGPLRRPGAGELNDVNGAFVENVILVVIGRLEFFQRSKFKCEENQMAIESLSEALSHLDERTARRVAEGTEGTHEV